MYADCAVSCRALILIHLICLPFSAQAYTIILRDNTVRGVVLSENAIPSLRGDHLTFSILRSQSSKYFTIHNRTGQLSSARSIDRDLLCSESELCCSLIQTDLRPPNLCPNHMYGHVTKLCLFNLSVSVVAAHGQQPDIYEVEVMICEENDHAPVFEPQPVQTTQQPSSPWIVASDVDFQTSSRSFIYQINVSEAVSVGHRIRLPRAKDIDAPPFEVQRYVLEQLHVDTYSTSVDGNPFRLEILREDGHANAPQPDAPEFRTQEDLGIISNVELVVKEHLDRETVPRYNYRLLAIDGGLPPRTGTLQLQVVVVDSNDHAPHFSQPVYQVTVNEGVSGKEILRVTATDADEGANAVVRYGWASWGPFPTNAGDSSTDARSMDQQQPKTKDELAAAPPSYWFRLNSETGGIYIQNPLDYEVKKQHRFQVIAYNPVDAMSDVRNQASSGTQSMTATATVIVDVRNLDDEAPQIVVDYATGGRNEYKEIRENGPSPYFVAFITVSDPDLRDESEVFRDYPDETFDAFMITCQLDSHHDIYKLERDKLIRTASSISVRYSLSTKVSLDREASSEHRILITCQDSGSPHKVATAFVTVKVLDENDCEPDLQVFVPAQEPGARPILKKPWSQDFLRHILDRHADSPVSLLSAYDTATPVYSVHVSENQPAGTIVAQVRATDKDSAENGRVTFELPSRPVWVNVSSIRGAERKKNYFADDGKIELLSSPEAVDYFQIDATRGDVSTRKMIDRENAYSSLNHLFVVAKAIDHGYAIQHSTFLMLHIIIVDENDNPPVFVSPTMHFEVPENVPAPALVGEIHVYDSDLDTFDSMFEDIAISQLISSVTNYVNRRSRLHVRIDLGHGRQSLPFILYRTVDGRFFLNTTRVLDRESEEAFQFGLVATDSDQHFGQIAHSNKQGHTATASVLVTVLDMNDNQPEIIFPNPSTTNSSVHRISYREHVGYDILNINANDRDASETNGKFYFEIIPNTRSIELFSVDRSTGVLRTRRRLTKDDLGEHILQILVRDEGTPPLETRLTLRLLVDNSEPHQHPDLKLSAGSLNPKQGLNRYRLDSEQQTILNSYQTEYDRGEPNTAFKRTMQSDVLLIIIVAMIMILMLIMVSLCFYLRHKRNLFGFLPDLCTLCNSVDVKLESTDLAFTQKPSPYLKDRLDTTYKRNGLVFDTAYSGLMDSLLGCEQQHEVKIRVGQSVSPPPIAPPFITQTQSPLNVLSGHYHSSINLNSYLNKDPNGRTETHSRMLFSPTVIGSDGLFTSVSIPAPLYQPDMPIDVNIPDVADQAEHSRKSHIDCNRTDQPFAVPLTNNPQGGYENSLEKCGSLINAYNFGHRMPNVTDHRLLSVNSRFHNIDFRPIPDDLHVYQRIPPNDSFDQHFAMVNTETDSKLPATKHDRPNRNKTKCDRSNDKNQHTNLPQTTLTTWRSDPSICQCTDESERIFAGLTDSYTLGFSRGENHKRKSPVRRSNSQKRSPPSSTGKPLREYCSDLRNRSESRRSNTGKHAAATYFTVQPTPNYAVSFPRIQASFV